MDWLDVIGLIWEAYIIINFVSIYYQEKSKVLKYFYIMFTAGLFHYVDTFHYPFFMLLIIMFLILYCAINFKEPIYHTASYMMIIVTILYVLSMFTLYVENIFIYDLLQNLHADRFVYPVCMISGKMVFMLIFIIWKQKKPMKEFLHTKQQVLVFTLLEFLLYCLMNYFLKVFLNQSITHMDSFMMILLFTGIIVLFFYLYNILAVLSKQNIEERIKNTSLALDKSYQKNLMEIYEQNRSLSHDMRGHFSIISQMLRNHELDQAKHYIDEISNRIQEEDFIHTNRSTLNYILNAKITEMKKNKIKFVMSVQNTLSFIDDVDLCTLLGNLLDNSIEAALTLKEPSIEFMIDQVDDSLYISIRNSFDRSKVNRQNGQYITSKKDKKVHGLGLKNIQSIVEKYQGEACFFNEDQEFVVFISFCDR